MIVQPKPSWVETPKGLAITLVATAAIAGVLGFNLGQNAPPAAPTQIIFKPGSIVVPPTPEPPK